MKIQGKLHGITYSRNRLEILSIVLNRNELIDYDSIIGTNLTVTVDESGENVRDQDYKPVVNYIKAKEDYMNKAFIKGRFADNPELRKTPNGKSVLSFTLGVDNGEKNPTSWISCVAWGQNAEVISSYFFKGDEIIVCGKLLTRISEYLPHKVTELHVEEWEFGSRKKNTETSYPNPFKQEVKNIEEETSI